MDVNRPIVTPEILFQNGIIFRFDTAEDLEDNLTPEAFAFIKPILRDWQPDVAMGRGVKRSCKASYGGNNWAIQYNLRQSFSFPDFLYSSLYLRITQGSCQARETVSDVYPDNSIDL